jgi:hypothetical protein
MPAPRPANRVRQTPNFDFLFGTSGYGDHVVPYFQVQMSLQSAADELRLVNEMPGAVSMALNIEELFQRDINWTRVDRKIVPYLKNLAAPQFFNSLTIALLPINNRAVADFSSATEWQSPQLPNESDFAGTKSFGPITCGYWGEWKGALHANARLGQICWNKDQVCGVAIDGQHRLAAIKSLASQGAGALSESTVPVILVVLHPDLGFRQDSASAGVVDTLRKLFIDLNKHARTVSRARQILLDDRDPASLCVRAMVGKQLTTGDDSLRQTPPHLPLTLVDWHSEQAKFDEGPYLTTILGLDWMVATLLAIKPLENPLAFDEHERLLNRLESTLSIDLSSARERLAECRRFDRPFTFRDDGPDELSLIERGFQTQWSAGLITLLTAFRPYKELIRSRITAESLQPDFANWFAVRASAEGANASPRAKQMLSDTEAYLSNREPTPIAPSELQEAVSKAQKTKKRWPLAYLVVFQRALVLAYQQMLKISANMATNTQGTLYEDADDETGSELSIKVQRAEELVAALNKLVGSTDFLKLEFEFTPPGRRSLERFWLGSLQNPDASVDFTQAAAKRASDLLFLAGLFHIYQQTEDLGAEDFQRIVTRAEEATTGIDLKLQKCFERLWAGDGSGASSIAMRIVQYRGEDTEDESLRSKEIISRASWIWRTLAE